MAARPLNTLADSLLAAIAAEKEVELSKTAAVAHTAPMTSVTGKELTKLAAELRRLAANDISVVDLQVFKERYGL